MSSADGLWIFIAVTGLNVFGLLFDFALLYAHQPTITEFCQRNQWAAWIILILNAAGLFGLGIHLTNGRK